MTVKEALERMQRIDLVKVAEEVIVEYAPDVEMLNRDQMMKGQDGDGKPIRPRYSEDPFFKTRQQAEEYIRWKWQITPNPFRDPDTPNLFINGQYHYSRQLYIEDRKIKFKSADNNAPEIESKYKNLDGLSPESVLWFREKELYPEMIDKLSQATGLRKTTQ